MLVSVRRAHRSSKIAYATVMRCRILYNDLKSTIHVLYLNVTPQGVGTVVSGTCMQGVIRFNDTLLLGPTSLGEFVPVTIRGIQRKRLPVQMVKGGQTASFALKKVSIG